jgi:uncharacterized protein YkwD
MGLGRALRLAVVASVLVAGIVEPIAALRPPATAASTADPAAVGAEALLLARLNADRASVGLVALRVDPRLAALARSRATDMADLGYFDHQQPDGRTVFDMIETGGIGWYGAAETIAWNTLPVVLDSGLAAEEQWMESPPHREVLTGAGSNYIGVGSASDATGRTFWTAVLIEGPDRTPPSARLTSVVRTGTSAGRVIVRVSWSGADVELATHTAGLRDFQVQRRVDGGSWVTVRSAITATSLTTTLSAGHRWEFRVRARDRADWYSSWAAPRGISS